MKSSACLRLDELPRDAASGYLFGSGDRANNLHPPVRGNGDSGAFSTTADLHRFWAALFSGRIVSAESVATMLEPVSTVPEMNMDYGLGFWLRNDAETVILEGCDASASFRSTHEPRTGTTVTVISNTTEGAWPTIEASL